MTRCALILLLWLTFYPCQAEDESHPEITVSTCRLNRRVILCKKFKIEVRVKAHVFTLEQHINGGKATFSLPMEVRTAADRDLIVQTPEGAFEIDDLENWWWTDNWELGLEHRPFSNEYGGSLKKDKKTRCFGYLVYTNTEPGRVISTTNCK